MHYLSAVANAGLQLAMTGQVNWSSVGQSAVGGALGGAFSFGVGQMFGHGVTDLGQFATKTVAHGVSGGLQNMIQGGDFGSGFMSGSVGHATGFVGGSIGGDVGGIVGSGLGGGISSSLSGGDFGRGFQTGAMQYLFNRMGEGIVDAGVDFASNIWESVRPNQVTFLNFTYDFEDKRMDLNVLPGISVGRSYGVAEGKYSVGVGLGYKGVGGQGSQSLPNFKSASVGWSVGLEFPVNFTIRGRRWSD